MSRNDLAGAFEPKFKPADFEPAARHAEFSLLELARPRPEGRLDMASCMAGLPLSLGFSASPSGRQHAEMIDRFGSLIGLEGLSPYPVPSLGLEDAQWPQDPAIAPDTWHLPPETADATFDLTLDLVKKLIAASHFAPDIATNGKMILSLRGCVFADPLQPTEDQFAVRLRATRPDHVTLKCLIGVIDLPTGRLSLYPASTVPDRESMLEFYNALNFGRFGERCNLLPTGLYEMCVGTHDGQNGPISYILRMGNGPTRIDAYSVTVLRSMHDLAFTTTDIWDTCLSADNLLPTFQSDGFSSSGCLTVEGGQKPHQSHETGAGAWRQFRRKLGFDGERYGARFDNLLTTGHEMATLAATEGIEPFLCLRQGSSGPAVAHLQASLGLTADGQFAASTCAELARRQVQQLGFATGSWGPGMARCLVLEPSFTLP